jgi:hypothetical protein
MYPIPKKWLTRWLLLVTVVLVATTLGKRTFIEERIYVLWIPFYVLLLFTFTHLTPRWAGFVGGATIAIFFLWGYYAYFIHIGEAFHAVVYFSFPVGFVFLSFFGAPGGALFGTICTILGWGFYGFYISKVAKRISNAVKRWRGAHASLTAVCNVLRAHAMQLIPKKWLKRWVLFVVALFISSASPWVIPHWAAFSIPVIIFILFLRHLGRLKLFPGFHHGRGNLLFAFDFVFLCS